MQQKGRVEFDIRIQPAIGLMFMQEPERGLFDTAGEIVQAAISAAISEKLFRGAGQDVGARIADAIHAMTETHEPLAAVKLRADNPFGVLRAADFENHFQRRTGRAAM
jgi:hypothetical protein